MTKREALARAVTQAIRLEMMGQKPWSADTLAETAVDALLQELREPDEAMLDAFWKACAHMQIGGRTTSDSVARAGLRVMINHLMAKT